MPKTQKINSKEEEELIKSLNAIKAQNAKTKEFLKKLDSKIEEIDIKYAKWKIKDAVKTLKIAKNIFNKNKPVA